MTHLIFNDYTFTFSHLAEAFVQSDFQMWHSATQYEEALHTSDTYTIVSA